MEFKTPAQKAVFDYMALHPDATQKEISQALNVSEGLVSKVKRITKFKVDHSIKAEVSLHIINEINLATQFFKISISEIQKLKTERKPVIIRDESGGMQSSFIDQTPGEIASLTRLQKDLYKDLVTFLRPHQALEAMRYIRNGSVTKASR